jgi:hypothetical protein
MAEQGPKPERRSGKEPQVPKRAARRGSKTDQETLSQPQQPRRVPGLNGYDPKLWPDVCR